jgi:hypothetical protein
MKTKLVRLIVRVPNTLRLQFIHHFAVKLAAAVCVEMLTFGYVVQVREKSL